MCKVKLSDNLKLPQNCQFHAGMRRKGKKTGLSIPSPIGWIRRMQTIGHWLGVRGEWEPTGRNKPNQGPGNMEPGGEGGREAQNTGIMEIKSHPCAADPRHIELSGRLIHARDSRHPALSGIKTGFSDEQLDVKPALGAALLCCKLRAGKIERPCVGKHFCTHCTLCTLLHTTSGQGRNKKCACKKLAFYVSGAVSQNIRSGPYSSLRPLHILICHGKMWSRVTLGRHQGDKSEGDEQWTDWLFVWICYSKPRLLSSHCELDNNTNTKVQEDDNSWFNRV